MPEAPFSVVEVEVNSRCNRKCDYCPVSTLPLPAAPRYMSEEVFERLLGELRRAGFGGRFSYHFYNEPLLRKDLDVLAARVSAALPAAQQVLYTNGDLLTDELYGRLLEAGVSEFVVTSHGFEPVPERPHQKVLFPTDLHITNRGGVMGGWPEPYTLPCHAPSEMLIVSATGDVLLCYEDAERTQVMGNIMRQSVEEIWYSEQFVRLRRLLAEGRRAEAAPICGRCNNTAHPEPGTTYFAL